MKKSFKRNVLETHADSMEVKLTFLESNGPNILIYTIEGYFRIVDPRTTTRRTHNLSEKEIKKASEIHKKLS